LQDYFELDTRAEVLKLPIYKYLIQIKSGKPQKVNEKKKSKASASKSDEFINPSSLDYLY